MDDINLNSYMCTDATSGFLKSPNNHRSYKSITLENGLRVVLVNDPVDVASKNKTICESESSSESESNDENGQTDHDEGDSEDDDDGEKEAAAALSVDVGSLENLEDVPGIAHLVEHVLFMGNKEYQEENGFDSFLNACSGGSNATTYHQRTVFEFEVPKLQLEEALRRFAFSFISPLFNQTSIDKEISPVDAEYLEGLSNEDSRLEQFFTIFAKPGHSLGTFSWGNRKSFVEHAQEKGVNLRRELVNFWETHYIAEKMVLVVQSQEPFENLERFVKVFSGIPSAKKNHRPMPIERMACLPYCEEKFFRVYYVKPVMDFHRLLFTWSLPSQLEYYKTKPMAHIGNLIGHEGRGGLVSCLRKKGLATSLSAGNDETDHDHNIHHALFTIDVTLTKKGLNQIDDVIANVFGYLSFLHRHGPQKYYFDEEALIELINLRYEDEASPIETVKSLALHHFLYEPKDILIGPYMLFKYDKKLIEECLSHLSPNNFNLIISSRHALSDEHYVNREPWFDIKYASREIPLDWTASPSLELISQFKLPEPNKYIATDFELVTEQTTPYPKLILQNEVCKLWFKKDDEFKTPKGHVNLVLFSTYQKESAAVACALDLFIQIVGLNVIEDVYPANLAGLTYSILLTDIGLIMSTDGFTETLPKLTEVLVSHLIRFECDQQTFDSMCEKLAQNYYNDITDSDCLSRQVRFALSETVYWTADEKRNALPSITREVLFEVHKRFFSTLFMESLIQGNFTKSDAKKIIENITSILDYAPLKRRCSKPQVKVLPDGRDVYCRLKTFCQEEKNTLVMNYYQLEQCDIKELCYLDLLGNLMYEPAFDELRTKQGLGYSVSAQHHDTFGIGGYSITVNSPAEKYTCSTIDEKIEEFISSFMEQITNLSDEQFDSLLQSRITIKSSPDLHLKEETDRNWEEIISFNYCFDRLKKEVKILEKVEISDFKSWALETLSTAGRKKLSVQIVGNGLAADRESANCSENIETDSSTERSYKLNYMIPVQLEDADNQIFIQNIDEFKKRLELYPVTIVNK